jgi:hypothetical protein
VPEVRNEVDVRITDRRRAVSAATRCVEHWLSNRRHETWTGIEVPDYCPLYGAVEAAMPSPGFCPNYEKALMVSEKVLTLAANLVPTEVGNYESLLDRGLTSGEAADRIAEE